MYYVGWVSWNVNKNTLWMYLQFLTLFPKLRVICAIIRKEIIQLPFFNTFFLCSLTYNTYLKWSKVYRKYYAWFSKILYSIFLLHVPLLLYKIINISVCLIIDQLRLPISVVVLHLGISLSCTERKMHLRTRNDIHIEKRS